MATGFMGPAISLGAASALGPLGVVIGGIALIASFCLPLAKTKPIMKHGKGNLCDHNYRACTRAAKKNKHPKQVKQA